MNDSTGKTVSSLAITEKRHRRAAGCVGIFFQLFDWNRKFAKKKLFSEKLLPPALPKQSSSKFGGDEKLLRPRLIANENSGGFPDVKKHVTCDDDHDQKPGMRPPGLVARLMGLNSMPATKQDDSKKASLFENGSDKGVCISSRSRSDDKDSNIEKGNTTGELRPQKLQKAERQQLSRFGAEALQFKSVLSRSRKQRLKLPSSVRSPRLTTGRNSSMLIDAAAKILEPGLQARNRAKSALTYSNTTHPIPTDDTVEETVLKLSENCNYHVTTARSLQRHSCKNCDSSVDSSSFQVLERSKPDPTISSLGREKECVSEIIQEQPSPFTAQASNTARTAAETILNIKPINLEDEIRWHWTSQPCKTQKDVPSSIAFKHNNQRQSQVLLSRDRGTRKSNLSSLQTSKVSSAANAINKPKDFVTLNRSLSRAQSRMPAKDNCNCDTERKSCSGREVGLSPIRKRRSTGVNQQVGSSGFVSSTFAKQRNVRTAPMAGIGTRHNAYSVNRTCSRSIMAQEDSSRTNGNKNSGVVSFTFSSPVKQKTASDLTYANKIYIKHKIDTEMSAEKSISLSGDALGAIIEQKLKELTCQEEDELATGGIRPKRTRAVILQELIYALTAERPISHDDMSVGSNKEKVLSQAEDKTVGASLGNLHLSPGSVLEASFSNDSCFSSSVDDSSARDLHPESAADLSDSATSFIKGGYSLQFVTNLLGHISDVLSSMCLADTGLKGSKLVHAEEVILVTELIFGKEDFSLSQFLVNELETLANVFWAEFGHFLLSVEDAKELKQFFFDCVIEYLDCRYVRYCESGFKAWARMPLWRTDDDLLTGVVGEVRRWTLLAGMIPDEIVETEMSLTSGKWLDFEIEGYETGAVIDGELLQILVDEIVIDLCEENVS